MSAKETEMLGVNILNKFGSEWVVVGVDDSASPSTFDVDITGRNNDITDLLDGGQSVQIAGSTGNDGGYTVASGGATDNGDGTATVPVDESIPDTTADGALYFRPLVGGQTGGTLTVTPSLRDILVKSAGVFGEKMNGRQQWDVGLETVFEESDQSWQIGANGNVELEITYNSNTHVVNDLDELTATMETEFNNTAGLDEPLWRYQRPTGLEFTLETVGSYLDPASTAGEAINALQTARENGDSITFTLYFGDALEVSGEIAVGEYELDAPSAGDKATLSFTLPQTGGVNVTGQIDQGLGLIMEAWRNRWKGSVLLEPVNEEDQTTISGATAYRGEVWVGEFELSATSGEELTTSASLPGEGKMDKYQTA